jgi:hypothetical protein
MGTPAACNSCITELSIADAAPRPRCSGDVATIATPVIGTERPPKNWPHDTSARPATT